MEAHFIANGTFVKGKMGHLEPQK
ncbi:uncharacterized protein METZ01_LOCUS178448 [marine metagenome]|uniref:Uncharacterized protein n=1 Tax=marine metagenome TaxID=408172 RepID=A0A382CID2_9ZZZZ